MSENSLVGSLRRSPDVIVRAWREVDARLVAGLLVVSIGCGAMALVTSFDQGWWHHDDGSIAQSADRVLSGELPHRDFAELYTGLLSFVNAGLFALFGENMMNLRIPLFLLFLVFLGACYGVARRIAGPWWAFAATLFAVTWTLPIYAAPMPSWYLLFLSTIGMYSAIRFFETRHRRWLLLAGICGGIALTIKIVGVWYVVAVLLALLAAPLLDTSRTTSQEGASRARGAAVTAAAALAAALVALVLIGQPGTGELVSLFLPIATLCGTLAIIGWRAWRTTDPREPMDVSEIAVFLAGVIVPVGIFVTPYVATWSVGDLINGVLIEPQSRFEFASQKMPDPVTLLWAAPLVALFYFRSRSSERRRMLIDVVAGSVIAFLVMTASTQPSYSILWETTRALAPVVIVVSALAILRPTGVRAGVEPTILLVTVLVAGFATLSQFPFAAPLYFCYVAPLVLLAALAGMQRVGLTRGLLPAVVLVALVIFGFRQLDHQTVATLGYAYQRDPQVAVLDHERASIRVAPEVKSEYDRIRELVVQHRLDNNTIYAGPDAPEIYFLTRSRNPTRSILDFLDDSGSARGSRLIALLESEGIPVVVLNHSPEQSPPLDPSTVRRIRAIYGGAERVRHFEVMWLEADATS